MRLKHRLQCAQRYQLGHGAGIHDSKDGLAHFRVLDRLILILTLEPLADIEQRCS